MSTATSFLASASYPDPSLLRKAWEINGFKLIILLSAPIAWLNHALLTFQAALLSLVWLNGFLAAQILVTTLIGCRFILSFGVEISYVGIENTLRGLVGNRKDLNHRMATLTAGEFFTQYAPYCLT